MRASLQPPTKSFPEKVTAWVMLALAAGLGGVSMMSFGFFLYAGPPGLIKLDVGLREGLLVNTCLSLIFFVQHSYMVRQSFRRWLGQFVPEHYLGAVYSITSGVVLLSVVLLWQESQHVIVSVTGGLRWTARLLFVLAVAGIFWGALALRGFDSFGLIPIRNRLRMHTPRPSVLAVRGPYRWVRHPLYFFVLLMIWSYPILSVDRALFNVLWSAWIVIGTVLEERDLVAEFGSRYRVYQRNVPMLIPSKIMGWTDPADTPTD